MKRIGGIASLAVCNFNMGVEISGIDFKLDISQIDGQGIVCHKRTVVAKVFLETLPGFGIRLNNLLYLIKAP